jgi:signal transduction histidine kinase
LFTALFVLVAQLLILVPSLAGFEQSWLADRVDRAEVASVAVDASPTGVLPEKLSREALRGAEVVSVAVQTKGVRRLMLAAPRMEQTPALVDLRSRSLIDFLAQPFITLGPASPRMLRVVQRPQAREESDFVEIVLPTAPLRAALWAYLWRLVFVSVLISILAGGVVYLLLNALLVRPISRITEAMERFRAKPDDPQARLAPSNRRDEIGRAEVELDRMQEDLLVALQSRARLAALGEAVAKINHDLRNMLTSAQMASERLASSPDPRVAQAMPRLERALDRAVKLAEGVLAYGRSEEPAPQLAPVPLKAAITAAAEDAGLAEGEVKLTVKLAKDMALQADADQLHRLLVNLLRNARQAIAAAGAPNGPGAIRVTAEALDSMARITLTDNGPGVPERVRERLFQPFSASQTPEGSGLGLAISRELARAHGGDLELAATGPKGATFELTLPLAG